jgi:hypothetical protein
VSIHFCLVKFLLLNSTRARIMLPCMMHARTHIEKLHTHATYMHAYAASVAYSVRCICMQTDRKTCVFSQADYCAYVLSSATYMGRQIKDFVHSLGLVLLYVLALRRGGKYVRACTTVQTLATTFWPPWSRLVGVCVCVCGVIVLFTPPRRLPPRPRALMSPACTTKPRPGPYIYTHRHMC